MNEPARLAAGVVVALTVLALVACDLLIGGFRTWWDQHSLTASLLSNLLVLAWAALVVDEVVARRQRRQRAVTVAAQGLILFGQARRTFNSIMASDNEHFSTSSAPDELRSLAGMFLTASSSLFEDPAARRFLEQAERFAGSMVRAASASLVGTFTGEDRERLDSEMSQLQTAAEPLLTRIPSEEWAVLEGLPQF